MNGKFDIKNGKFVKFTLALALKCEQIYVIYGKDCFLGKLPRFSNFHANKLIDFPTKQSLPYHKVFAVLCVGAYRYQQRIHRQHILDEYVDV